MSERVNAVLAIVLAGAVAALTAVIGAYGYMLTRVVWSHGAQIQNLREVVIDQGAQIRAMELGLAQHRGDSKRTDDSAHR